MPSNALRELVASLGAALVLLSVPVSGADTRPTRPMIFGGKVLEVHQDQRWFLMNGGASRKYSRVRILHDLKTKWTGVPLAGRALRLGEPVQVTVVPTGDAFRAVNVLVLDPNAVPGGSVSPKAPPPPK